MTSQDEVVRIFSAHSVSYAPQYVALELGMFTAQGLRASIADYPPSFGNLPSVLQGDTDLLLGSPLYADRLRRFGIAVEVVGQSNQHVPIVIARRPGSPRPFQWTDLRGSVVVISQGSTPTSWAAWSEAVRRSGMSLGEVTSIVGFPTEDGIREFREGAGDYFVGEAGRVIDEGLVEVGTIPEALGPVAWSIYLGRACGVEGDDGYHSRFRRAIAAAQQWLYQHGPDEAAAVLAPSFPEVAPERLRAVVARYLSLNLWVRDGEVVPAQLQYWGRILDGMGLMATSDEFAMCGRPGSERSGSGSDRRNRLSDSIQQKDGGP